MKFFNSRRISMKMSDEELQNEVDRIKVRLNDLYMYGDEGDKFEYEQLERRLEKILKDDDL